MFLPQRAIKRIEALEDQNNVENSNSGAYETQKGNEMETLKRSVSLLLEEKNRLKSSDIK